MTLFVTLLVIVLLFIALILYSRQKTADRNEGLELTSNLTAQINQTLLLSKAEPLLALKLAETLPGEARELALQLVASELYLAGHKTQARELYQQLPPHARDYVLNTLIETLLDSDDTQACLELLENWGESLPSWPLLQVRILQARGEQERALAVLGELSDPRQAAAHERQSIGNLLILARLQHQAGMQDAALASVELAWSAFDQSEDGHRQSTLRSLFEACATLGQFDTILTRAAPLPAEERAQAVAALIQAGQLDAALNLLAPISEDLYSTTHSELMDLALARPPIDNALRLLDKAPDLHRYSLLLSLLSHLATQGQTAEAEALLLSLEPEPSQHAGLMLSLCEQHHATQPQWAEALLAKALQQIDGYKNDQEFWSGMRMQALHTQLQLQSRLPAHRRDSWLVRSSLEEWQRLHQQQDGEQQLLCIREQTRLLHDLGQTAQARTLLEQALELLDSDSLPEVDEMDKTFYLEDIASAYLSIDEAQQAQVLQDRLHSLEAGSRDLEEDLLLNHIEHQRYAQAIEALNLSVLLSDKKPLSRLYQALEELHQRAPERAAELQQQLMERFSNGQAWRTSQAN
ncbi:hypothetical protein FCI59_02485 [Pseudomonas protegens]|uniref:hypothetical protein n=1 Tax=Pseudomonas protegens TaxID=380021 RepID=UPI001575CDB7|nr:hypothetical protein [Pseudomonas protegens]NTZ70183.1 hypothetical protein [Pseudomonas protegens]